MKKTLALLLLIALPAIAQVNNIVAPGGTLTLETNVNITGTLTANAVVVTNYLTIPLVVAYSTAITVDFSGAGELWTVLGGSTTLSSSGLAAGRGLTYWFDNQTATNCSVILPSTWRFISGTTNNILATGKIGVLSLKSRAANDTNVVCLWASE